jgi:hypothetical protein
MAEPTVFAHVAFRFGTQQLENLASESLGVRAAALG